MYEQILLPTDGSDAGDRAVQQAIDLAADSNGTLHVLFVVENPPYAPELVDEEVGVQLRAVGETIIEDVRERAAEAGVEVVAVVREGTPHTAILEYATEASCDLIVMGTHGRSGIERYLIGSVTERVVRTSPVPVLTVRKETR